MTGNARTARILVAGASGQLAPAIVAGLARAGFAPILLTRSPLGDVRGHQSLVLPAPWSAEALAAAMAQLDMQGIVNLAAAGVRPDDVREGLMFEVNVALAAALIAASPPSVRAFVNIGSGAEYEANRAGRPRAESSPLTTAHPYGLSKAAAGFAGRQLAAERGIGFAHLRLFGAFGENEVGHRLLPSLVSGLMQGRAAALSDGLQVRDWLYEEDVGSAVAATVGALLSGAMASGIYNLGSGRGVTVRAFAQTVADLLTAPRDLLIFGAIGRRGVEGDALVADTTALDAALGWRPSYTLEAGLETALSRMGRDVRAGGFRAHA